MHKFFTTMALAAALIPAAVVAAPGQQRFTRDGISYVYTVSDAKGGRQVIEGRRLSDGAGFRLVVRGKRVDGTSGGQPVSFRTATARPVTIAAR